MSLLVSFETLSIRDKIDRIETVKQCVLGNDKEKIKIEPNFPLLRSILLEETNKTILKDTAIIVQSFSFLRTNIDLLVKYDILQVLMKSTVRYPALLAEINFRTILDLLSTNLVVKPSIDETYGQFVDVVRLVLNSPNSSKSLLFDTYLLIPFFGRSPELSKLYVPLMRRISITISPLFKHLLDINYKRNSLFVLNKFRECVESPELPSEKLFELYANEISPAFFALSHILSLLDEETSLPLPLYFVLTACLGAYNLNLKLSSVNVLVQYTKRFAHSSKEKSVNYVRLAQALVNLISRTKTTSSPQYTLNSSYKIPRSMSPLYLLSQIAEEDPSNSDYLVDTNFFATIANIITSNYSPETSFMDEDTLYKISDSLLIMSCIGGLREDYRELIIKFDIAPVILDSISRHANIYAEMESTTPTPNEIGILRLSNRITLSGCYLLRSLSRSASLLRTYLVDLKLVRKLVDLLHIPDDIIENCPEELKMDEIRLKSVVLGIVSNSIVEFSAVKQELASDELSGLLRDFIYDSKYDTLRMNSLWVIKNSLFGGNRESKENFQTTVSLDKIFELCGDPNERIQEHSFDILRNLAVGHFNYANQIVSYFPESSVAKSQGYASFLDFLLAHLNQTRNPDVIVSIVYVVVHLAASNESNRSLIMCNRGLLEKLVSFLEYSENNADDEDDWKIRLSVVWAVLNLSWREETTGSDLDTDETDPVEEMEVDAYETTNYKRYLSPKNRALRLIELGFYEAIRTLNNHCTISDFKERARMAIFNLVLYDNRDKTV
ncbi:hypothetical protein OGAPHI_003368 [Ogataea philodendri]|uniref:Armadillo repeat-containing protein 8 n=1 Tax=Ogataea philodendri TaxID=1378263 RepID=A0A9P8T5E7_9ASCO|nr:uncharacterized protein OGAPHI_003368 [Ogataea philodendri]KAH3666918.1 hypothetical protein OGAPHI_003368 [Ogataea philodendri]